MTNLFAAPRECNDSFLRVTLLPSRKSGKLKFSVIRKCTVCGASLRCRPGSLGLLRRTQTLLQMLRENSYAFHGAGSSHIFGRASCVSSRETTGESISAVLRTSFDGSEESGE